ncbi:Oxysterol-binding protein [Histomonas meleagridis]|uniref:Oxysterol-binding protein n=1 Tax=Histomonas meleagridis TaxID=135588 RepID=UPI00355A0D1C|nr:Oxysterol-binding protein [Histomonas meleagridis]KAH0805330.1 Oxysterol-binding protein [Histomonas meleagridis]
MKKENSEADINLDQFDQLDDFEEEEIPPQKWSIVWHLMKQLHIGMSLSRINLPTYFLETRSTIQRFTDWMAHADILRQIETEPDPMLRCLHLVTWIVSGFHLSPRAPRKPYNSLLGEVFRSALISQDNEIIGTYIAEQVSHHPPISAFHYCDRKGGVIVWGHTEMRSQFLGNSVAAKMDHENTRVNLELTKIGETYEFNFPDMYGCGLIFGRLRMEIVGTVRIRCIQTGVTSIINFLSKGIFEKRGNRFNGYIFTPELPFARNGPISFEGRWSTHMRVKDSRKQQTFIPFNVRFSIPLQIVAPPLEEQSEYESQNLWKYVSLYLKKDDTINATNHKYALEEKQRKEREFFEQNNLEWQYQAFHFDEETKRYVPNDLNLQPYDESEPPQTMPPPFERPKLIQMALDEGVTKTIKEIQEETENAIHRTNVNILN